MGFDLQLLMMILNLVLAAIAGIIIGYFRYDNKHGAGSRTFSLVAIGASLFTMISLYGFLGSVDVTRVAAGVVSGIGFIGAGVIWKHKEIHGVTTAAGMWVAASAGMAIALKMLYSCRNCCDYSCFYSQIKTC